MRFFVLLLILPVACTVDHSGLTAGGGGADDAFTRDAALPDAPGADVPSVDGRSFDGGPLIADAGPDVTMPDAGLDAGNDAGFDAGFDAGNDAGPPDPCTIGPDSDGDGVRDNCDACMGFDDRDDVDTDGIADGCDDWPCGTRPTVPTMVSQEEIQVRNVSIHDGGNTAVVRVGESFEITFDWRVGDEGCPGCFRQVEWGFDRTGRAGCVYDANPPSSGATGRADISDVSVRSTAEGLYELRFNLGQEYACDDIESWHSGAPGPDQTIGVVCVPPEGIAFPSP